MLKNKRGDVSDVLVVMLIGVFLAVSFIVVLFVNDKIKDVITDTALNDTAVASDIVDAFDRVNSTTVQRGYALFMGFLIIGVVISSFLTRLHPAFIFLYIIVLAFTIFVSVFLGNMYEVLISNDSLAATAENQGMITFFMQHIVKITLAIGALSMIIAFSKIFSRPGDGGGDI
jgi:hypothetical protein